MQAKIESRPPKSEKKTKVEDEEGDEEESEEAKVDPLTNALNEYSEFNSPIEHQITDQKLLMCLKVGCTYSIGHEKRIN